MHLKITKKSSRMISISHLISLTQMLSKKTTQVYEQWVGGLTIFSKF